MRRVRLRAGALIAALALGLLPAGTASAATSTVSIGDATVVEPVARTGEIPVEVPLTITPASTTAVSVTWRTVAGSATTADFVNASGTATIPAGAQGTSVVMSVRADRTTESTETFTLELTGATGATIADPNGSISIRQGTSGLAIGDVTATEPDAGSLTVGATVTLAAAAKKAVSFTWQLRSVTGTVGSDAPAASGTGTIARGALSGVVRVAISGDTEIEPDESLELAITSVTNASLADGVGTITLRNTDVPPPDPFGWQPPAGTIPASGTVVYLDSQPGDHIGQGTDRTFTQANALLRVTTKVNRIDVQVESEEDWLAQFAEPSSNQQPVTGYWQNLGRHPFSTPGLTVTAAGRGCNTVVGRFIVDEISYDPAGLRTLTLRFEQRCDASTGSLFGYVRYDATDPTVAPPPGDPADFGWSPPAGAVPDTGDYLYFESPPGDYVGGGRTELYTNAEATFVPDWGGPLVQLFVNPGTVADSWSANFSGPYSMDQLEVGLYSDLRRYPFHNPAKGGLSFSGEGRGCNTLSGSFAVDEISWDGVELASVSIRFVQRCEIIGPPLYGALRWTRPA